MFVRGIGAAPSLPHELAEKNHERQVKIIAPYLIYILAKIIKRGDAIEQQQL